MPKLTQRLVGGEKATGKDRFIWDDDLKGFGLRVSPTGVKTYLIQYRTLPGRAGRTRRLKLAREGEMTVREARDLAREKLQLVRLGRDPSKERQDKLDAPTVEELAERYLEMHARPKKKPSSVASDESALRCHILPALGQRKAASLTVDDVHKLHHSMRDTPYQANRTRSLLSKMLNLAEQWGIRPRGTNPCVHVQRFKEKKRERYLSPEELSRLGDVLTEAEEEDEEPPSAILAVRLLLMTGARKSEILKLTWDEVDFKRRCLRLRDSKTGEKVIPLGGPAIDLLREAPRFQGNPYVCPGERTGHHFVGLPHVWERLRERADLEDVRLHDLRHSFASVGAGGGLSLPVIGALLGHTQAQTTARYAHLAENPLTEAADQIGQEIAAHLNGGKEASEQQI